MKKMVTISIEDFIHEAAKKKAKGMGMNFSAYIAYLISTQK